VEGGSPRSAAAGIHVRGGRLLGQNDGAVGGGMTSIACHVDGNRSPTFRSIFSNKHRKKEQKDNYTTAQGPKKEGSYNR
jgi:hypothetical protein